ncbi:RNA 2',3'-cyclic phosphodiesterase [Nocardioides sp. ChNu-153]|uniref:RNA 2',3'-cyclic phosphodiesterase n=1 Tax=Nocardioides sp. ChNu-153 TaxID=2779364 RepID=UPI002653A9C4|nr:RNA 2',3'-cyclic phosphodiesterase [Nocardioides sp. ChNu-153]MDN7122070.1 RNA 2',3'-cyclic phosphodiesterase [Nocardioides sp. ChNu-153]
MRLFTALVPPADVLEHLDDFLDVRRAAADLRWSRPENLHVTLAFAADVEEWRVDEVLERTAAAAARRTPFTTRVAGGGAFPHPDAAQVLWAGLALDEPTGAELEALARGARAAVATAGAAVDGTRFRPHLTVARAGRPRQLSDWVRLLDAYEGPEWAVDEVAVVASHLGEGPRRRPRHEVLATAPLAG